MNLNLETQSALAIATFAHEGQKRANGDPFLWHPIAVAQNVLVMFDRVDLVPAAYLHDVLEDTPTTVSDLRNAGISEPTIRRVAALTRMPGELYDDYIIRVASAGIDCRQLKLADLAHNLQDVDEYRPGLRKRYERAQKVLALP